MYNAETGTVLSKIDLERSDGCKRYVCYMPTDLLFTMVKKDVLKEMNFNLNERFSLTSSLLMEGKMKKRVPVITESLSFRVSLMLKIGQKLMCHNLRYCENDTLKAFLFKFAMREKRLVTYVKSEDKNREKDRTNVQKNPVHGPLGFFYRVEIDREKRLTKCNCEYYNTWGVCIHVVLFEIVEFNCLPKLAMRKANGVQWEKIRERLRNNVICKSVFDPKRDEELEYDDQYLAFFPPVDPQYNCRAKIHK